MATRCVLAEGEPIVEGADVTSGAQGCSSRRVPTCGAMV
jgi:hypothetical protein